MFNTLALVIAVAAQPDLAVVICAPHGGNGTITGVAERSKKKDTPFFATVTDTRTDKLAHAIAEQITKQTRKIPFVIVATTSRKFVDLNRDAKSAFEDEKAKPSYDAYHAALSAAVAAARKLSPNAILLDIHGQGRTAATIYRGTQNGTTVKGFSEQARFLQQIWEQQGLLIEPSLSADTNTQEHPSFNGGYTVQNYRKQGIAAIQLEFGSDYRKPNEFSVTAKKVAAAITAYSAKFLQTNL